jgi:hypothetical protein
MRRLLLIVLSPLLLAVSGDDIPGRPPGVPERCCGYLDCRPAHIEILERNLVHDIVMVEGKRLVLPPGSAHRSNRSGSWFCFQAIRDGCHKEISERCARCAVEGRTRVSEMRVLPAPKSPKGTHLVLPNGGCEGCPGAQ